MRQPRNGSSPAPSATRPQRGSMAISTIGLYTQLMPCAVASLAAIRAPFSMASRSHEQDCANGMGNTVWLPWITSWPMRSGMPKRLFFTAICCKSLILSCPFTLSTAPSLPSAVSCANGLFITAPVVMSPPGNRLS